MTVFLVRHADAKSRANWHGDEGDRPLTRTGRRQADGLVGLLGDAPIARVLISPAVRCAETMGPLAAKVGVTPEVVDDLAEGAPADAAYDLLCQSFKLPGDTVLCTHGDLVPELLRAAARDGAKLDAQRWAKGSTWALTGDRKRITRGRYLPPPEW